MSTGIYFGPDALPQTGGSLPAEARQMYSMRLLKAAEPNLKHVQFCENEDIPKNMGTTMIFRRFELLAPTTTPLSEGVTPTADAGVVTPVSVGISQYGRWIAVTDMVQWASIDNVVAQLTDKQGEQAARSLDLLARTTMTAGTNVGYANSRTSRGAVTSGDLITSYEIRKAYRTLDTSFVNTYPDDCYVAIIHTHTVLDIQAISDWINVHTYSAGQSDAIYKGEIGMLYGIRFVKSNQAVIFSGQGSGGGDVYGTIFFGPEAFIKSTISGHSLEQIIKPLGAGQDALNQRGTLAWKATFGSCIANQVFVYRLEHATSA